MGTLRYGLQKDGKPGLIGVSIQGDQMEAYDDDLSRFEADGAAPLPVTNDQGYVAHDGAQIWYATYGSGSPVIGVGMAPRHSTGL